MTELDEEMLPLAAELIDEYGKTVSFIEKANGGYNPSLGKADLTLADPVNKKAIIGNFSNFSIDNSGGRILATDIKLIIAGAHFENEPSQKSVFIVDGKPLSVVKSTSFYSGDEIAIYEIQARQ